MQDLRPKTKVLPVPVWDNFHYLPRCLNTLGRLFFVGVSGANLDADFNGWHPW